MREIKFRLFNKRKKVMMQWDEAKRIPKLKVLDDNEENKNFSSWMQYTGLKDKNGKEIYEGDIVRVSGHPFQSSIEIDGNYEVGYNEAMDLCCGSLYLFKMRRWAEVIGNIYETPELLGESK